jgi:uncharacterized protein (TIGR03905 family)
MNKVIKYEPVGVCSREMNIEVEDNIVKKVEIIGGCPGNTQAVCKLCEGRKVEDVIDILKGIKCGMRVTSCPDQLARALESLKDE